VAFAPRQAPTDIYGTIGTNIANPDLTIGTAK